MVGPYCGVLPEAAVTQMEEQLSGACTVEIAGFNEFLKLLGDDAAMRNYDHIVLDTAPTGHTLRLLNLPSAWNDFIASNQTCSSCLGPIAGLKEQKLMFEQVVAAFKDPARTLLVLVTRAEVMSFLEAQRAGDELGELGLDNQHLIINGVFTSASDDPVAIAFAEKPATAMAAIPEATPTHEASALQENLRRAGIEPYGWIINRCFAFSGTRDPALCAKGMDELSYLNEIIDRHAQKTVISPWVSQELNGPENFQYLYALEDGGKVV